VAIDIDGDGDQEVVFSTTPTGGNGRPAAPNPVIVLDWRDGALVNITPQVLPASAGASILRNFVVADFNGDGIDDIFLNNHGTELVQPFPGEQNRLYLSDGRGGYRDATGGLPALTDFSHGSVAADFDGDGDIDLYVSNLGEDDGHSSYLLLNDGAGRFSAPHWANPHNGAVQSARFDPAFLNKSFGYHAEVIDHGGDGVPDIYLGPVADWSGGGPRHIGFAVARNDGTGRFTLQMAPDLTPRYEGYSPATSVPEFTRSGDMDGNGLADLVVHWADRTGGLVHFQVLLNTGAAGFDDVSGDLEGQADYVRLPPLLGTPEFFVTDIDADGDLDMIASRWSEGFAAQRTQWFEHVRDTVRLIDEAAFPAGQFFVHADVDGDGVPDLVQSIDRYSPDFARWMDPGEGYAGVRLGIIDGPVSRTALVPDAAMAGGQGNDTIEGGSGGNLLRGNGGNDILRGLAGDDTLRGGDGADTLNGGDGDDFIWGGDSAADLRDLIYGGDGDDRIDAGAGNDEVYGGAGRDTIEGGAGADTIHGQAGDDVVTGSAFADLIFGGAGSDFLNGGFGHDRVNGGAGADRFYHLGIRDHGSDWIQDYSAAEGDRLVFGAAAARGQFQVNLTETAGAGAAGVAEAFVIWRPTGQILWALVDGGAQGAIALQAGGQVFDLLA
jgi:Ca2+-binding RTX toxin-like protein